MTERAEHTAGPWTFDRDWKRIPTIIGADGSLVADIRKSSVNEGGWVVDMPEREANARLIAAAPDLMAALKDLVTVCEKKIYPQPDKSDSAWAKLQAARAAIARATGEA